jgi:hypothetical protein
MSDDVRKQEIEAQRQAAVQKLWDHLGGPIDTTTRILRAHLIVEEEINAILEKLLPNAAVLRGARLTFFQRVRLLRAIDINPALIAGLDAAEKLNAMRNTLAHQLVPSGLDDIVLEFVEQVRKAHPDLPQLAEEVSLEMKFLRCTIAVCGRLGAYRSTIGPIDVPFVAPPKDLISC